MTRQLSARTLSLAKRIVNVANDNAEPENLAELRKLAHKFVDLVDHEFDDFYLESVRVCMAEIAIELATM